MKGSAASRIEFVLEEIDETVFRYLFWFLVLGNHLFCFGQVLRARVINAKNGHPLPKQHISISLLYEKGEKIETKQGALLELETDINGEAQFTLPEATPAHLSARARLTSEHWRCGCWALVATQDAVQKGIVEGNELTTPAKPVKAEPGEILFIARPLTFLERLLYPLEKG